MKKLLFSFFVLLLAICLFEPLTFASSLKISGNFKNNSSQSNVDVYLLVSEVTTRDSVFCTHFTEDFNRVPDTNNLIHKISNGDQLQVNIDLDELTGFCKNKIESASIVVATQKMFEKYIGPMKKKGSFGKLAHSIALEAGNAIVSQSITCNFTEGRLACPGHEISASENGELNLSVVID